MIPWIDAADEFPPVETALAEPNGLLAASESLEVEQLIRAYRVGIFPWYGANDPVLWWSPNPRMVLRTDEFKVARSLRKTIRRIVRDPGVSIHVDRAFERVIRSCAAPRQRQKGTWIGPEIIAAYGELHRRGLAHSVEVWRDSQLVGGLYGVSMGRAFFGESMFCSEVDASKVALAALVALLRMEQVRVIDCQQSTEHLASLGAREMQRRDFCTILRADAAGAAIPWERWSSTVRNELLSGY